MKRPPKTPLSLILCLLLLPATGCCKQDAQSSPTDKPAEKVEKQPATPIAPPKQADTQAAEPLPEVPQSAAPATSQPAPEEPNEPKKRPKDSWVIFREAIEDNADADIRTEWRGGNKFRIETENVRRLTIDMTKLPDGPPKKGPWIIQIDDQGIELTGFKPKPGYTGHIRDLVRSKNGVWDVDRKRLYRLGG